MLITSKVKRTGKNCIRSETDETNKSEKVTSLITPLVTIIVTQLVTVVVIDLIVLLIIIVNYFLLL